MVLILKELPQSKNFFSTTLAMPKGPCSVNWFLYFRFLLLHLSLFLRKHTYSRLLSPPTQHSRKPSFQIRPSPQSTSLCLSFPFPTNLLERLPYLLCSGPATPGFSVAGLLPLPVGSNRPHCGQQWFPHGWNLLSGHSLSL